MAFWIQKARYLHIFCVSRDFESSFPDIQLTLACRCRVQGRQLNHGAVEKLEAAASGLKDEAASRRLPGTTMESQRGTSAGVGLVDIPDHVSWAHRGAFSERVRYPFATRGPRLTSPDSTVAIAR
jgi:hypothetical protein